MKVSVIIPNYNGASKSLPENLANVVNACSDCEIIVVDDASTDNSVDYIKENFPQIKIIENKVNQRFGKSCNIGVKAAKNEIVILLNSDVSPDKNFLKPLISNFNNPRVFSVGCSEIEKNNGKEIISGRTEAEFRRGFLVHWKAQNQEEKETFWTFGGSMAVNKEKFLALGGFDEIYSPAYWEDIDICFRARQKGWKLVFEKEAKVFHNHETTNVSVFGKKKMEEIAYRNQILFIWKNIHGKQLLEHFLWLPYHLVFTTLRSRGVFIIAFIKAIIRYFSYARTR